MKDADIHLMSYRERQILNENLRGMVLLFLWVVLALNVGASVVAGSDGTGTDANVTEITDCTVIDDSGHYRLTDDLKGRENEPCIEITGSEEVVLDGNGFTISNGRVGVDVRDSSNIVVKNLYVTEMELNGIGIWNSENVEIHGNVVSNTGFGEGFENNSIHIWQSDDIEIYNNTAVKALNRSDGIYAGQTNNVYIHSNDVENASYRAINTIESENIVINRNTVDNPDIDNWESGRWGIEVNDDVNVTVTNNFINSTWYGIEVKHNGTDVIIQGNQITNTARCAIAAEPSGDGRITNATIEDNFVQNTREIEVVGNVSDIVVKNNTIESSRARGILIKKTTGTVEVFHNRINGGSTAVRVEDTHGNLRIFENDVRQLRTGFRLIKSSNIRIERNRFTNVAQVFEEKDSTEIEYRDNEIDDSSGQSGPGFGIASAIIAVLIVPLLRRLV